MKRKRIFLAIGTIIFLLFSLIGFFYIERNRVLEVPILMYHKIGREVNDKWWVDPEDFEAQIRFLSEKGYKSILPSDLSAHEKWGKPLPSKPVIITLDDGYLNALTEAEPILKKYHFKAIVYLITEYVAKDREERKKFEGVDCLTWCEVREMYKRGTISFGAHSKSHQSFKRIKDPYFEVRGCYKDIRKFGGFRTHSFCYPFGEYNLQSIEALKRSGFTTGITCDQGVLLTGAKMKLYQLPRVHVIGGLHHFVVSREFEKEGDREFIFRVSNEGVMLGVAPRLCYSDEGKEEGWLPLVDLGNQPLEWRWALKEGQNKKQFSSLEIWDKARVLCLSTFSLKTDLQKQDT
ncbi:MAG: polysaccharide deacetylase family protein [Chlamydiae bacterium]|nr:polysaccharide deacetylase family protein [Chlamydiota bacterium]MBI3276587.1 polysaccharide deacetylase family protein [Chlamydiota bacterium]